MARRFYTSGCLRVATPEEVCHYGKTLPKGLIPPIAGGAPGGFSATQGGNGTGTSTSPGANFAATPMSGSLLIAGVASAINQALTMSSTGWTALTSVASTSRAYGLFWKVAGSAESKIVTAISGSGAWAMVAQEYSTYGLPINAPTENAQANAAATIQTTPTVTPATSPVPTVAVAICGNTGTGNTWSSRQINGTSTGVVVHQQLTITGANLTLFSAVQNTLGASYVGQATGVSATGGGCIAVFSLSQAIEFSTRTSGGMGIPGVV